MEGLGDERNILRARKLIEPAFLGKDQHGDFGVAKNGELEGLLQQPLSTLGEGDLPTRRIFDSLHLNLSSHHVLYK